MRYGTAAAVVLFSVSLGTASGDAGRVAYVNNPRGEDGARSTAILWQSHTAQRDCVDAMVSRFHTSVQALLEGQRPALPPGAGWSDPICANALLGDLTQGTEVELLDEDPDCGALVRVRVASGRCKEQVGCVSGERLSSQRTP
jgi:hypothetical protein